MNSKHDDNQGLVTGLALGLLTGVVLTLLYTPKSGKALRGDIDLTLRRKKEDLPKEFGHLLEDIRDLYHHSSEFLTALTREQAKRLETAVGEAQRVISEQTSKLNQT